MQYKTIILELLEQFPAQHERLRRERRLLATLEALAIALKARHEAWMRTLSGGTTKIDPAQMPSAALEMAVEELEHRLRSKSHAGQPLDIEAPIPTDPAFED